MMNRRVYTLLSYMWAASIYFLVTETTTFYRKELCDVQARLANKCMREVIQSESAVRCCVRCHSDEGCVGASVQVNTSSCYLHGQCSAVSGCTQPDQGFLYYQRQAKPLQCVNGTWDETTESCQCSLYFVGELCDRYPYNCTDLRHSWLKAGQQIFVSILPPGLAKPTNIYCTRDTSSITTFLFRHSGLQTMNLTRQEYDDGFGNSDTSFFAGLKALRLLVGPGPRNLSISVVFKNQSVVEDRYTDVVLADTKTVYAIRYNDHTRMPTTSQENCLELSNGSWFSTWDFDYDKAPSTSWAKIAGSGWWFPSRNFTCNPLGLFYPNVTPPPQGDCYFRYPGISSEDISKSLLRVEMSFQETV